VDKQTDATERSTHASGYAGVGKNWKVLTISGKKVYSDYNGRRKSEMRNYAAEQGK